MHGPVDDPLIARAAAELRRSVPLSPDFDSPAAFVSPEGFPSPDGFAAASVTNEGTGTRSRLHNAPSGSFGCS